MEVMKQAWAIAKAAVVKFGGKVKEYFAESLKLAWATLKSEAGAINPAKTAEIRFPYAKKHWVAKIVGSDAQYKLRRNFLDAEEDGNDIVYSDLTDGYYQFSRFGKPGVYLKVTNGETVEVEEKDVTDFFKAPKKGMSSKEYKELTGAMIEDGYGERYEFAGVDIEIDHED